jgi:hypothetical protein
MTLSHTPRIVGGHSLHTAHDPQKCPRDNPDLRDERCGSARCVDCCRQVDGMDVEECTKCGRQRQVSCYFDEDFS